MYKVDKPIVLCKKCNINTSDYYKIVYMKMPSCTRLTNKKCNCYELFLITKNLILEKYKNIADFFVNLNTYSVYGNLKFYFYACKNCVTENQLLYLEKYN